jgi:hypothetical protein
MLSRRRIRFLALLLAGACTSSNAGTETAPARGDSRTITAAELATATQLNLYDYVRATRPLWLQQPARSYPCWSSWTTPAWAERPLCEQ